MYFGKKIVVVMPAYNAEKTLMSVYNGIPFDIVDEVILVDDCSRDNTVAEARKLPIKVFVHQKNRGYGAGNRQTVIRRGFSEF